VVSPEAAAFALAEYLADRGDLRPYEAALCTAV
jgi:hypothetical protein